MIKWTPQKSRIAGSTDWVGQTDFGRFEITRISPKVLGTPWRMRFPTGQTMPVANVDLAKDQAEQWLARKLAERGKGTGKGP